MESFFSRYKNPLVLALVLLAQFALLAVQVRPHLPGAATADQAGVRTLRTGAVEVITPPGKILHHGTFSIGNLWSKYVDLLGVREQNDQLKAQTKRLQIEEAALAEDARQGERLQEILAFKQHYIDKTVPAQVVGSGGSDHGQIVYIDKGSNDGITVDMPVITPDGIVGKIRSVTAHSAQVLEISDPTSAAGVLLEATRTRGLLRGNTQGQPQIVNLMPDNRIQPGQLVLTSGGDQIFPRGLPVGTVDHVQPDADNQPLVDVVLKPAARLHQLEEVLVITQTSSKMSAQAQADVARNERTIKTAAQATAAQLELGSQRASDILAERLPSATNVTDTDVADAAPGSSPLTAGAPAAPLHPLMPLHSDRYSPGFSPSAQSLTPGKGSARISEGIPSTDRGVRTDESGNQVPVTTPSVSPAFQAAHEAAMSARPHAETAASAPPTKPAATNRSAAPAKPATTEPGTAIRNFAARLTTINPQATPKRPAKVPTRIIDDGPLPGATRSNSKPVARKPQAKQAVVPDDGSHPPVAGTTPPSTTPQENP